MVRLGDKFWIKQEPLFPDFNSTMVRLGAGSFQFESVGKLFQFHYGAIGSYIESIRNAADEFQFHYGAIGSLVRIPAKSKEQYFNSTMVRLGES